MSLSALVLFMIIIEAYYRSFIKYKDPVTTGAFNESYREGSLIGYHLSGTGPMKAVSAFPEGDTIFNTDYTLVEGRFRDGQPFSHRIGYNSDGLPEYVFLGCSFTFGDGLADTATLPWQFGKLNSARTVNLGCSGYGLHQVYQMFKSTYSGRDNSNRTFVYSFLSDHFLRATGVHSWNIYGPYFTQQNDSLRYAGRLNNSGKVNHRKWGYYLSLGESFNFIYDNYERIALSNRIENFTERDYTYCFNILKHLAREIQQSGGRLVILNWNNDNWGYRGFPILNQEQIDADIMGLETDNVAVFNASDILDLKSEENFIPYDGHPNRFANEKIARFLSERIK